MANFHTLFLVAFLFGFAVTAPMKRQDDTIPQCVCSMCSESRAGGISKTCMVGDVMMTNTQICEDGSICTQVNGQGVCFSSDNVVLTDDLSHAEKTMQELEIGDRVLSVTKDGNIVFSPVIAFLTRVKEGTYNYIQLETDSGHTLKLTPDHLVFRNDSSQPVFASAIQPGDYVFTIDKTSDVYANNGPQLQESRVIAVRSLQAALGGYSPLTTESTIIVNGVSASCYGGFADQYTTHAAFAPLRFLHHVIPSVVEAQQEGKHWYVKTLLGFGQYMRPLTSLVVDPRKIHPGDVSQYSIF